jgi:HAD superfamily hydrolase (TIGR01509 family)
MNWIRCSAGVGLLIVSFVYGTFSLFASTESYDQVRAIVFDCDGVLVDTEYLKFLAWQEALTSHQIDFALEEYMPLVGHSSKNILKLIGLSKGMNLPEQIIDLRNTKYKTIQQQGVTAIQPMVDFARALSENKQRLGVKLGLASSAPKEEILINLRQVGLDNAFDLVISGTDDLEEYVDAEGKNKPKPYIYIEAAKRLNIPAQSCLVFEDTFAGVEAAADAGMLAIAIPNRFTLNQDFSKAWSLISSYEDLPSIELFQQVGKK